MITVSQIRERLVDLLASFDDKSLAVFEEWLTAASWDMHFDSDLNAQKFVGEIQLRIAETDDESQSFDWLKGKLRSILYAYSLSLSETPVRVSSGSSTIFTNQEWAFSPFGSQRAVACG
jgi:hypothetical protein